MFTFNRWCASHKTFSFLTSSFLGFGSIRWIWHITHKIQEDSISKKASSWKVKLFDKSPFKVRSTSSIVSDENGVFGELFFLSDIMPLPSRIYTEIPGVFRYGKFLIIVWFWYDMKTQLTLSLNPCLGGYFTSFYLFVLTFVGFCVITIATKSTDYLFFYSL